jgi:hypothetical protein
MNQWSADIEPAVKHVFSGLVDGADLEQVLCKVDTEQFMLHLDADLTQSTEWNTSLAQY